MPSPLTLDLGHNLLMKITLFLVPLTLAAGMAGAYWAGRHFQPSPVAEASVGARSDNDESGVGDDIARLEGALARTQGRLAQLEARGGGSPTATVSPAAAAPKQQPQPPTREQLEQQFEARSKAVSSEPRDQSWAGQEEQAISSAVKAAMADGVPYKIDSLSCRTTICRMEISHANALIQQQFASDLTIQMANSDALGYHFRPIGPKDDGTQALEVLLFRRGYPMPGYAPED